MPGAVTTTETPLADGRIAHAQAGAAVAAAPRAAGGRTRKTSTADRIPDLLARTALFSGLSEQDIALVTQATEEVTLRRGQALFQQGDPCLGFHVVVFGQIKLYFQTSSGAEKVARLVGAGDSFGEALVFMDSPYILSAQALADSLLLHVGKDALTDLMARDITLARRMLASLSQRLHARMGDIEAYSLRSGMQRVIGYLLQGRELSDGCVLRLETSKSVIASRLNLTPEHFSRILNELAGCGLIRVKGRDVTLVDVRALGAYQGGGNR